MSASDITTLLDLGYSNFRGVSRKRVGRWLLLERAGLDDSFYRLDKMSECCQSSQRVSKLAGGDRSRRSFSAEKVFSYRTSFLAKPPHHGW